MASFIGVNYTRKITVKRGTITETTTLGGNTGDVEYGNYGLENFYVSWVITKLVFAPGMQREFEQTPTNPQNPNEFTAQEFERFKTCLSMFKVYYQGHKFENGGEANFQGHSDSRRHWFSPTAIGDFTVRTDQQSYSTRQLGYKRYGVLGTPGGRVINGFTDSSNPNVNAIAYDAVLQGREALALWVHELGNALSYITNISIPVAADAADRYDDDTDQGTAFEDCVFGGRVTKSGIRAPKP
jgi:hypothetical protein